MTVPVKGGFPIEVDIAVGIHGERCGFRVETVAAVVPHEFVAAVQGFVESLLWPVSPEVSGECNQSSQTGSVVSGEGAAARSRAAAPEPPPVAKFDPDRARRRAAEGM